MTNNKKYLRDESGSVFSPITSIDAIEVGGG